MFIPLPLPLPAPIGNSFISGWLCFLFFLFYRYTQSLPVKRCGGYARKQLELAGGVVLKHDFIILFCFLEWSFRSYELSKPKDGETCILRV